MRRLGGVTAALLVLGAIGIVAILLAVYGVGCFQLRRPSPESSDVLAPATAASTDREGSDLETSPQIDERESNGHPPSELEAAAVIHIGGVVIDFSPNEKRTGVVAPGVEVQLGEGFFGKRGNHSVRTGDDGKFTFVLPDPRRRPLDFTVDAEGSAHLRPQSARGMVRGGQREVLDLVIRRVPMGDLAGVTVDMQGRPVPGVHLAVSYSQAIRETDSDGEGQFRIPDAEWLGQLKVSKEGYALLSATKPSQIQDGGWDPMRVVLAPTAKLVVRAVDGNGDGIEGVRVAARVAEWESNGPKRYDEERMFRTAPGAITGSDGRAPLEGVWAGQQLALDLDAGNTEDGRAPRTFEREQDGRLLQKPSREGRPILLAHGESRELMAIFDTSSKLRGIVVDELSKPEPAAYVRLEGYQEGGPTNRLQVLAKCDSEGRFAFEIPFPLPISPHVTATDRRPFGAPGKGLRVASLPVDLGSPKRTDLVLVLHSAKKIAGRVIAPDGKVVRALVSAFLAQGLPDVHARGVTAVTDKNGSFEIEDVEPGLYELVAQPNTNDRYGEARMVGVEAGREDVEMVVPPRRSAHVVIEASLPGGEVKGIVVADAWPRFPASAMPELPELPADAEYREPGKWPSGITGAWGTGGFEDESGAWTYHHGPIKSPPVVLDIEAGAHWFAVHGTDSADQLLFPVGTGLVRVGEGEHRLRFELTRAVRIEGRLVGSNVLDYEIGIARRGGQLLEVDAGYGEHRTMRPVGSDGSFSFWAVPVGDNEIWIGTADELAAGKPGQRQPLTVEAKGVPFLEIPVR